MEDFLRDALVRETAGSVLAALPTVREKFARLFDGLAFDAFMDAGLSAARMSPKIDVSKFERYVRESFDDCGKEGLDMVEFLTAEFGEEAAELFRDLAF
jgi:hypothetical protein